LSPPGWLAAVAAQTGVELRLTLRRGESLLITLIVPVLLLVFFSSLGIVQVPGAAGPPVQFLLPGMIALAVMSTGMVSVGIATAYERYYGVLKLLGGSPLPRAGLIGAKLLSVVALEIVQVVVLLAVATAGYGWRPAGSPGAVIGVLVLGTAAFTGLGLAMAGGLRAEMTLAGANGLYLVFLLLGDAVLPLSHLPAPLQVLARVLPAAPLTDALRAAMGGVPAANFGATLIELAAWALVLVGLAALTFRWE
jgi:ABC-2 type transport system permease protein